MRKKGFPKDGKLNKDKRAAATVIFVPSTKGCMLIKSLKEEEEKMAELTGFKVKFQEAGGSKLVNCFDKDLGKGQHCGRSPCPPCDSSNKRENCRSRNLVYESKCRVCNPVSSHEEENDHPSGKKGSPREGIYIGETSRSLHEGAVEHIVKHWMTAHADLPSPP